MYVIIGNILVAIVTICTLELVSTVAKMAYPKMKDPMGLRLIKHLWRKR